LNTFGACDHVSHLRGLVFRQRGGVNSVVGNVCLVQ